MKKTLSFKWGSEKQVKVSKAGHTDSLFYEAYRQAMAGVIEIVCSSRQYTDGQEYFLGNYDNTEYESSYLPQNDKYCYNYPSNMIVFSGERGVGKSSALLTFIDSLSNPNSDLYKEDFLNDVVRHELPGLTHQQVNSALSNIKFVYATPVDPTKLEDGSHILAVILAKMFKIASDIWENENDYLIKSSRMQERLQDKNSLLEHFTQCYQHILAMKNIGTTQEYEVLDVLKELGDTVELKREFTDLVSELLKFCFPNYPNSFLILQIDDTDMNVKFAYKLLEDLRKYLVIPRVIIVMAADLEHLTTVVENEFLNGYNKQTNERSNPALSIATQYITKLFPQTRQIWLPSLKSYLKEQIDDVTICYTVLKEKILPEEDSEKIGTQNQILRLIYEKTGIVFLKGKEQLHYIIPDNMRVFSHFLAMLAQMESIEDPDQERAGFFLKGLGDMINSKNVYEIRNHNTKLQTRLQNIQRFRDYFIHTWVNNNLSTEHIKLLNDLHKTNLESKIRFIFKSVAPNFEAHLNYVNLMSYLHAYEVNSCDEENKKFSFAVRQYFSLLAHCLVLEQLTRFYEHVIYDIEEGKGYSDPRMQVRDDLKMGFEKSNDRESPVSNDMESKESSISNKSQEDYEVGGVGVEFRVLYSIFGSHLFPATIPQGAEQLVKASVSNKVTQEGNTSEQSYIYCHWKPSLLKEKLNKGDLGLNTYCTLLLDYKDFEGGGSADLTSCITNCLYYSPRHPVSDFVKKFYGEQGKHSLIDDRSSVTVQNPTSAWQDVQNDALLVVLNSDVQEVINETILHKISAYGTTINEKYKNGFDSWVKNFLDALKEGFIDDDSNESGQTDFNSKAPIRCLEKLNLSSWVNANIMRTSLIAGQEKATGNRVSVGLNKFFAASTLPKRASRQQKTYRPPNRRK